MTTETTAQSPAEGPTKEVIYASWGGNGRGSALRQAYEQAVERDVPLLYLAILDEDAFGDLDDSYLALVVDELEWLLDAQMRLAADQLGATEHSARFVVQVGDVGEEVAKAVAATHASLILIPADAQPISGLGASAKAIAKALGDLTNTAIEII